MQLITVRIVHEENREDSSLNNSSLSLRNYETLEVPCETFSRRGKYIVQYFIKGVSKSFKQLRKKISVRGRREKIRLDVLTNYIAISEAISLWIKRKKTIARCKPYNDRLQLYWINSINKAVLVHTKAIKEANMSVRTQVKYPCNIFDTQGIFYVKYISGNNEKTLARSKNISVFWGNYKLNPQSKSIFPCATTFAVKFTSPYCEITEDKIEVRSKTYNNVIAFQSAYPGFRSVFFSCGIFKRYIREYCFYYITMSSLTKTEHVQAKMCLPSLPTGACVNCTKFCNVYIAKRMKI